MAGVRNLERKSDLDFNHIRATTISRDWFRGVEITDHALQRMRDTEKFEKRIDPYAPLSELRKLKKELSSVVCGDVIRFTGGAVEFAGRGGVNLYVSTEKTMYVFKYDERMVLITCIDITEIADRTKPMYHAQRVISRMAARHIRTGLYRNEIKKLENDKARLEGEISGLSKRKRGGPGVRK